ncbi:hypothetical protein IWZ00DRAFT_547072 [Phyllosticta capitalensis]|uniref:uncharacterized protein n=1 Tax=Phyllosticta capitalensis TaxID=121624 RepID=UPI00312F4C17
MDDDTVGMEVDPDIAAAMGFAAFGSSTKGSRKFGGGEAVTENHRPRQSRPTDFGTDANRVELGPRKRQGEGADMTDLGPRKRKVEHHDVNPASKAAYTSDVPTGSRHAEAVTAQSDMRVTTPHQGNGPRQSEGTESQSTVPAKESQKKKETVPTGLAAFLARGKGLPEKPPTPSSNHTTGSNEAVGPTSLPEMLDTQPASTNAEPDLHALRNGIRNENGDIAYFLPSFIEDPWAHLEKS